MRECESLNFAQSVNKCTQRHQLERHLQNVNKSQLSIENLEKAETQQNSFRFNS